MKPLYSFFLFALLSFSIQAQYNDPNFPKPASGYGSDGTHTVGVISFSNPAYPAKDIEIYYPSDITGKVPTIFYSHAYGGNISANISGMLNFVAKKGYAIVYVPYQTTGVTVNDRYDNLLNGFRKAARDYPTIIDTAKVGFMGHSFGGGASFGNGYKCFVQNNWGQSGRFIYALAQWYTYNISQSELQAFPANTKLLTEIFDDDDTNDHRMAVDIFNTISIPVSEKDLILLRSDTIGSKIYAADHVMPNTSAAFDALDYYAYYRFIDALCDYTFNGNIAGKNVALGNGSAAQITMPTGLKPLVQTDQPFAVYPESNYQYPCNDPQNPRIMYCPTAVGIYEDRHVADEINIFPNPASQNLYITFAENARPAELKLYDSFGRIMTLTLIEGQGSTSIDVSSLHNGVYFLVHENIRKPFMIMN
jgi:hypothetical protein